MKKYSSVLLSLLCFFHVGCNDAATSGSSTLPSTGGGSPTPAPIAPPSASISFGDGSEGDYTFSSSFSDTTAISTLLGTQRQVISEARVMTIDATGTQLKLFPNARMTDNDVAAGDEIMLLTAASASSTYGANIPCGYNSTSSSVYLKTGVPRLVTVSAVGTTTTVAGRKFVNSITLANPISNDPNDLTAIHTASVSGNFSHAFRSSTSGFCLLKALRVPKFKNVTVSGAGAVTGTVSPLDFGSTGFAPGSVVNITPDSNGNIYVVGSFTSYGSIAVGHIARLFPDGSLDTSFNDQGAGFDNTVRALKIDSNGKLVVVGSFNSYNGSAYHGVIRLNADGSIDTSFTPPNLGNNPMTKAIAIDSSSGKIYVGGWFFGVSPNSLIRLNTNGTLDGGFAPSAGANQPIDDLLLDSSGNVYVAGAFTSIAGSTRNRMAKLSSTGALDATFDPNFDSEVLSIAFDETTNILAAGQFTHANGVWQKYFAKIDTNSGTLVAPFNASVSSVNGQVSKVLVDVPGDRIFAIGSFTYFSGGGGGQIASIGLDGTYHAVALGNGYDVSPSVGAFLPGNKIVVSGGFSKFNNSPINSINEITYAGPSDDTFMNNGSGLGGVFAMKASGTLTVTAPSFNINAAAVGFAGGSGGATTGAGNYGFGLIGNRYSSDGGKSGAGVATAAAAVGGSGGSNQGVGGAAQGSSSVSAANLNCSSSTCTPANAMYMGAGGGGGGGNSSTAGGAGANGGGVVMIFAHDVALTGGNMSVSSNGGAASSGGAGAGAGGAGGASYLVASTIAGSGTMTLTSNGGAGTTSGVAGGNSGGGAGGASQIISCTESATVVLSAAGAAGGASAGSGSGGVVNNTTNTCSL